MIKYECGMNNHDINAQVLFSNYVSYEEMPASLQSTEALKTWQYIYKKKQEFNNKYSAYISPIYLSGVNLLKTHYDAIPTLSEFNAIFKDYDWKAVWIPGYVPGEVYASLLANGYFPIAKNIRSNFYKDYSPVPDFLHDVWGHLPFIFDKNYSSFLKKISAALAKKQGNEFDERLYLAQKLLAELQAECADPRSDEYLRAEIEFNEATRLSNKFPSTKTLLARMFLWTIEFGVIGNKDNLQIIGAGILSSFDELISIVNRDIEFKHFDQDVVNYAFSCFSNKQKFVFIASDIEEYSNVLSKILKQYP